MTLQRINHPLDGNGFHTFRRLGTALVFDSVIQSQDIMAHGLWQSPAVWSYMVLFQWQLLTSLSPWPLAFLPVARLRMEDFKKLSHVLIKSINFVLLNM